MANEFGNDIICLLYTSAQCAVIVKLLYYKIGVINTVNPGGYLADRIVLTGTVNSIDKHYSADIASSV